ncbi:carbonic anhydrase [Trichlorobacter ammonificans]|uniref:carbonic anhydrase n=1 Tax=Trichlorobacter ammonificans TaxID=2916410 RepID=A0ABM9D5C4_9BACT|nr:carbonic anhydrase [Trichlorobacter ammonificans]CAH2030440.1 Carbonic anhydrase [Trichlorobacter ammonificans]
MITMLLEGNKRFVRDTFEKEKEYFAELAKNQRPTVLWIGCSDSRVPVNTITQTRAGEVFTLRNVGNIVAINDWSLSAVLEFSINHLNIPDVVICGHYNCGAINALMHESPEDRYVPIWLNNAYKALERVDERLRSLRLQVPEAQRRRLVEEENVRLQLEHLMEYPFVRRAILEGKLTTHGWIYDVDTGEIKVMQKNTVACLDEKVASAELMPG